MQSITTADKANLCSVDSREKFFHSAFPHVQTQDANRLKFQNI